MSRARVVTRTAGIFFAFFCGTGCGDDGAGHAGVVPAGAGGTTVIAGAPGVPVGGTTAGRAAGPAGSVAVAGTGAVAPSPGGTGAVAAGTGATRAGSGGAGAAAGAGAGVSGSVAAGSGGTSVAGMGAAGAGGVSAPGGGLIRGPDPTMQSVMGNGSFQVESYTDGFQDGLEFLAGTIYYPTDATPPFGGVVVCPGFTAFQDSVAPWGPFLASHGIVVMTIDTNTNLDSVDIRQGALMDALASLKAEQTREGSPLKGKLDMTRFGVMGWSMGGGGTWLNANTHPELKTGISLAGHIATQIGGAGQFTMVTVPVLLLAGSADTEILGLGMSQPVYEAIPESTPKILYEVDGATHFDISPSTGGGLFGMYGLSWQKVFLEGDERYRKFLTGPEPNNASDFRSNVK